MKKYNIGIIGNPGTHPSTKAFLSKFVRIINAIADETYVMSVDKPLDLSKVHWLKIEEKVKGNILKRFINLLLIQLNLSFKSIKISKEVDVVIILPTSMFLPIITLKLMKKKTMVFAAQKINGSILMRLFSRLSFIISDFIIVESELVIKNVNITRYKKKIVKGSIYVNTDFFKMGKNIHERRNIIGYIGILEKRKGVEKLCEAIPEVIEKHPDINFLIGGVGPLSSTIKSVSEKNSSIKFKGFIPDKELQKYYNEMKLFILPSLSEGVPNVVLEAMACGTPVLTTPVGGIPDLIKDGETGFIMEDNSPECIAMNVMRALNYPNLDRIVKNARKVIEEDYTYKSAVDRYKKILEDVFG